MGRLSPLKAGLITALPILLVVIIPSTNAAPVQETSVSRHANEKGCYYLNKLYPSGDKIQTNEPCLNCTCIGSTLMCYLRVCPFVKPMGENCVSEMHVGDCCPKFWCPEVYPRSTTEKPDTEPRGCYLDGKYYDEGARIPMDPMKPCEVCYCIRNTSVCTVQECELNIDGCFPQYKAGSCCPSRYNCTDQAATTIPPDVMEPEEYEGCRVNGIMYKDGESVLSADNCETCYCMRHEVVCAVQDCTAPADNCVPGEIEEGQCCPTKYECPPTTERPESSTTYASVEDFMKNISTTDQKSTVTEMFSLDLDSRSRPPITHQDVEVSSVSISTLTAETKTEASVTEIFTGVTEEAETLAPSSEADVSELVTITPSSGSATVIPADMVSRPREPKITEVPDDFFTPISTPKTTSRPVFYPSRPIPGEGICRHENKTYQSKEKVPSADPCRLNCICLNSVVQCELVECVLTPPDSGKNCKVKKSPEECCPKYICDDSTTASDELLTRTTTVKVFQQEITDELTTPVFHDVSTDHKQEEISLVAQDMTETIKTSITTEKSTSIEKDISTEKSAEFSTSADKEKQTQFFSTASTTFVPEQIEVKSAISTVGTSSVAPGIPEIISTTEHQEVFADTEFLESSSTRRVVDLSTTTLAPEISPRLSTPVTAELPAISIADVSEKQKDITATETVIDTTSGATDETIPTEKITKADIYETEETSTIPSTKFEFVTTTRKSPSITPTDFEISTEHLSTEAAETSKEYEEADASITSTERTTLASTAFEKSDVSLNITEISITEISDTTEDTLRAKTDDLKTEIGSSTTSEQKLADAQTISPEMKTSTILSTLHEEIITDHLTTSPDISTTSQEVKSKPIVTEVIDTVVFTTAKTPVSFEDQKTTESEELGSTEVTEESKEYPTSAETTLSLSSDTTIFEKKTATLSEERGETHESSLVHLTTEKLETTKDLFDMPSTTTSSVPTTDKMETLIYKPTGPTVLTEETDTTEETIGTKSETPSTEITGTEFAFDFTYKSTGTISSNVTAFDDTKAETTTMIAADLETKPSTTTERTISLVITEVSQQDTSELQTTTIPESKLLTISKSDTTTSDEFTETDKLSRPVTTELPSHSTELTVTMLSTTGKQTSDLSDEESSSEAQTTVESSTTKFKIPDFTSTVKTADSQTTEIVPPIITEAAETTVFDITPGHIGISEFPKTTTISHEKTTDFDLDKITESPLTEFSKTTTTGTKISEDKEIVTESSKDEQIVTETPTTHTTQFTLDAESLKTTIRIPDLLEVSETIETLPDKTSSPEISTTGIVDGHLQTLKEEELFITSTEVTIPETEEQKETSTTVDEELPEERKTTITVERQTEKTTPVVIKEDKEVTSQPEIEVKTTDQKIIDAGETSPVDVSATPIIDIQNLTTYSTSTITMSDTSKKTEFLITTLPTPEATEEKHDKVTEITIETHTPQTTFSELSTFKSLDSVSDSTTAFAETSVYEEDKFSTSEDVESDDEKPITTVYGLDVTEATSKESVTTTSERFSEEPTFVSKEAIEKLETKIPPVSLPIEIETESTTSKFTADTETILKSSTVFVSPETSKRDQLKTTEKPTSQYVSTPLIATTLTASDTSISTSSEVLIKSDVTALSTDEEVKSMTAATSDGIQIKLVTMDKEKTDLVSESTTVEYKESSEDTETTSSVFETAESEVSTMEVSTATHVSTESRESEFTQKHEATKATVFTALEEAKTTVVNDSISSDVTTTLKSTAIPEESAIEDKETTDHKLAHPTTTPVSESKTSSVSTEIKSSTEGESTETISTETSVLQSDETFSTRVISLSSISFDAEQTTLTSFDTSSKGLSPETTKSSTGLEKEITSETDVTTAETIASKLASSTETSEDKFSASYITESSGATTIFSTPKESSDYEETTTKGSTESDHLTLSTDKSIDDLSTPPKLTIHSDATTESVTLVAHTTLLSTSLSETEISKSTTESGKGFTELDVSRLPDLSDETTKLEITSLEEGKTSESVDVDLISTISEKVTVEPEESTEILDTKGVSDQTIKPDSTLTPSEPELSTTTQSVNLSISEQTSVTTVSSLDKVTTPYSSFTVKTTTPETILQDVTKTSTEGFEFEETSITGIDNKTDTDTPATEATEETVQPLITSTLESEPHTTNETLVPSKLSTETPERNETEQPTKLTEATTLAGFEVPEKVSVEVETTETQISVMEGQTTKVIVSSDEVEVTEKTSTVIHSKSTSIASEQTEKLFTKEETEIAELVTKEPTFLASKTSESITEISTTKTDITEISTTKTDITEISTAKTDITDISMKTSVTTSGPMTLGDTSMDFVEDHTHLKLETTSQEPDTEKAFDNTSTYSITTEKMQELPENRSSTVETVPITTKSTDIVIETSEKESTLESMTTKYHEIIPDEIPSSLKDGIDKSTETTFEPTTSSLYSSEEEETVETRPEDKVTVRTTYLLPSAIDSSIRESTVNIHSDTSTFEATLSTGIQDTEKSALSSVATSTLSTKTEFTEELDSKLPSSTAEDIMLTDVFAYTLSSSTPRTSDVSEEEVTSKALAHETKEISPITITSSASTPEQDSQTSVTSEITLQPETSTSETEVLDLSEDQELTTVGDHTKETTATGLPKKFIDVTETSAAAETLLFSDTTESSHTAGHTTETRIDTLVSVTSADFRTSSVPVITTISETFKTEGFTTPKQIIDMKVTMSSTPETSDRDQKETTVAEIITTPTVAKEQKTTQDLMLTDLAKESIPVGDKVTETLNLGDMDLTTEVSKPETKPSTVDKIDDNEIRPKSPSSTTEFKTSTPRVTSKFDQKEAFTPTLLDAEVSTTKPEDVFKPSEITETVPEHIIKTTTTATEISTTEIKDLGKTEVSVVLEDTIQSNRTFAVDSMIVGHSTTPMTEIDLVKEPTTETFGTSTTIKHLFTSLETGVTEHDVSEKSTVTETISTTSKADEIRAKTVFVTDTTTQSVLADVTTQKEETEPHMLESTTVKVTAEDISTPVSTATELEEAPDHKITLTDVSETKFSQSTSEEETVKTTLTAVPVTTMKKTSTTEIPDKSAITHEEIITSESPSEMSVLTSTSQDVASTEEPFAFAITKKIPTTQESAETTIFDTTIAAEKPDKEISTEEIFTEERKTVTPFEEPSDISKQSSTFTTADAFKSTTGKQFSELETKTPTEVPEKFEIITTRRIFDESKLQTETATQAIDIKSTQTILTETPFDENAASLQPLTVTDFSTEKTLEDKLITQAKFKVTSAASTETLEEKTETVHTFDTTVPSAEIKTTTSKEITPPFSDESMTSEQLSSTVHFVTPKDISFEMTSSEETSTSKMPTSAEERTKATQESTSAAATEELDSGKQFSATMVETTGSPEALPEIISSKAFEISTTEAVIDDSKKITTDQAETFQSTETPESVIELTPSTTKIAVDTLETEILERKPQSTLKPLEDEVTITPIISEKEETDVTVQEGEEKESVETSSLLDELLTTSTTKVNITSEPISVVTESTSSTATTTAETVTETFTHLLDEVNVTLTEEKDVKSTTVVLSTKGIDEDDITSAEKSDCLINGTSYGDGESILTVEPCEKCHCATGEIICFKIICKVPKQGCIPVIFKDECCPTSYKCPTEEESTEIVTLSDSSSPTEKYITTPIPISFMFSTIPTSISTTILTSKPSDLEDEIKASTETGTEFSTSEKESSFTPETTVSTIKAFDEQTRLTAPERTSESIIGVTEKETSVSESISSLKTTPTITESSPSIIPLSTLNIFDESSNKTALKEESDVTVETLQSETTPKPTDAHKLKDFETTLSIVKASTEEKSIEPEVITESFKPSILTDKADEEITIATSTKAEKTPELTTKSSDISSSTITSFSSASTSHISVTEETSAVEPDITTKELPFETTTKFKDTETTPFVEKSESTAKAVTISETTKTSITRVEIDLVTTAASVLDEEVKPKYLSTVSESGTSTITSISSAVTSDEKSAEITTGVESDTRTDEVTPESLHISTKFDKFKGIETTALDEKITTKGKGTESEATSDVTESSVFTPEASKTSPSGEETKIKPAFTTLESNLSTISYESTDGDKFSETTTFDTTTKVVISDTTPESTDVEQVRGIETTVSDEKISTTRKSELSSETVATSESTQPLVSAIEADSFTKETFTKLDETRLEPTFTTVESGSTMFSSASSVTATDERKTETTSEKEHSSELTTYEDVQSVRDFETTTSTEKVTTEEKISETLLVSDVTESEAFTLEKVNATATPPMKSDVTLTPSESSLPTTTSLSFVPISDDEAAETSPVVEPTTELLTKMTPKSTEAEKQAETTLSEETMSTEVAIKETTITRESTGATVFSLETDNVTTLPSTLVDEIKLKPITLTSETATSPTITVPTMGISDEILKTTETVSEKFDSTPATEKDEFRVTVSEAEKVDKTESVITTSKTVGFPKLSDFTTMDSEESPKTQEISTSTSIPIKLPKLEDSVTSTVRIPTVEISTEKSESLFTTAKVHAINVSTDVTEEQTATMFPKETSQGMTTFESTKFDVDKITIEFTEKSESKAETTTLRDEFRTLGSKVTDGLRFDSTDITSTFTTSSPALSTEIEAKINDTAIAIDQERTPLPHTSISEMLNIGGISTMGPPLILTSDRTSIDITTTAITFKDEGIVTELRTAGTTQSERISDTSSPETESSEAFEPVTGSMQETTLFKTSTVPSEDRLETNTTTTMKSETSTDISQSTAFAETEISINITDDKKVAKTSVTDFTALRELTTKSLLDVTTYEDITSQEAESSESFETFTETAQVNQTVVSLSKERTPVFEDNVTDASLITELDVANKTFVTERSFTPVPEDVQKVKTTLQPRITTKSDETKPTDEIFNFVSTRFADVTKFTKSEDVDESKIPIGDDVEISRTPTDIQRKTTFADTSITEKETTTIFKQPVRSTTVSSETFDTEESLITSESPVIIPKESFTTKGPAIKSLEDVPTTPFSFENKTTTKVLLDELTTKPVSETAFSTGSTQLIAEEITTRESLGTSESETKIPKAEMTSEISGVVEFSTHIEELTTSIPRMISTLRDKLDIVTEGKIGIQEGAEVTTLFTEKPSLSTEGSLNETLTTEEKELTDILGTSLSSTTIEISKKFPDTSTQQSESTTIQQKIKTDLPSKSSVSDEEITELFEASVTTASQELETEVTSEKKDDQLLELTTTEVRVIEDEVSIHSTPTSIGTSLPSIETESSLSSKNATFTTLPDIKPDSMSTANITSVTDESDIEAKISTLTPLIKLDLSSTISSLISTTVEELSSSVKDHESSTAATIKPITLKEFEDVTVITKKTAVEDSASTLSPITPTMAEGETILFELNVTETTAPGVDKNQTAVADEEIVDNVTESFTKITQPSSESITDLTSRIPPEESTTQVVTESSTKRKTEPAILLSDQITTHSTQKLPESSTQMTEVSSQMTEQESQTTVGSVTDKSIEFSTQKAFESTTQKLMEPTSKSTELPTKAYKGIETTPLPITSTFSTIAGNVTDAAEDDYQLDEGACIFDGQIFQSAEQIVRADPCEFCFCFRGDIICLQQSCPPPAPNCHRTMIHGYCCPRYDCPVLVTARNISSFTRRKGVQPIIIQKRIEKRAIRAPVEVKGCQINGTFYEVGSTVTKASGPCLHCLCEGGGNMRCDPLKCKPQPPLMLKMNNGFFRTR